MFQGNIIDLKGKRIKHLSQRLWSSTIVSEEYPINYWFKGRRQDTNLKVSSIFKLSDSVSISLQLEVKLDSAYLKFNFLLYWNYSLSLRMTGSIFSSELKNAINVEVICKPDMLP